MQPETSTGSVKREFGINAESLVVVRRTAPDFTLSNLRDDFSVAAGIMGSQHRAGPAAERMSKAGNEAIASADISDPAIFLAKVLSGALRTKYQLALAREDDVVAGPMELPPLPDTLRTNAGLILDVRTVGWRTFWFLDSEHYDVFYAAKVKLVDARHGTVLREEFCGRRPVKSPDTPSLEQLLAKNGVLLKSRLDAVVQVCLSDLRHKLGIAGS